jgi:branched-chain amino acid transport system substrate-binding protein
MSEEDYLGRLGKRNFSRRRLLGGSAVGLAGLAGLALVGCGDDDDDDDDDDDATATEEPGDGTATATATGGGGGGDVTSRLQAIFPEAPGPTAGMDVKMASVLALSGNGSFYGQTMSRGIDLAVKHLQMLGGPNIELTYIDHKSGDATAGQAAAREIASAGDIPYVLSSYGAVIGSMLPIIQESQILVLDGGGGNGVPFDSQPFFWGTRAWVGLDSYRGFYEFLNEIRPDGGKRVASVWWDIGPALDEALPIFEEIITSLGYEMVADERTAIGATDYSAVLARIEGQCDVVDLGLFGTDTGYFMKQFVEAGLDGEIQAVGHEFVPDAADIAGDTFANYWFAYDYFGEANATSDWAKLFREEFAAEYGTDPDFYAANFYEDTFIYWTLMNRVLDGGGEISGTTLQDALIADPTFKILYGGEGPETGTMTFNLDTHAVTKPQGVFNFREGAPNLLANIDVNGLIDIVENPDEA